MKTTRAAIAGVPALVRCDGPPAAAAGRGTVLYYHGFGGDKERCEPYLTALAAAGFLAVSLDAACHGDRRLADFETIFNDERWDADFEATETDFLQLIDDTAAEVPSVLDDLAGRGWARPDRMGIGGRSLGGNISYAAVLADQRLRAAVSVVGSPEWTLPRRAQPAPSSGPVLPGRALVAERRARRVRAGWAGPRLPRPARALVRAGTRADRVRGVPGHRALPHARTQRRQQPALVAWFERWLPDG